MSGRDYTNPNPNMTSDWDSQDGPDIGVWNPVPTNTGTSRQGNTSNYASMSGWNMSSQNMQPQGRENVNQTVGDINSNWRDQSILNYGSYYDQQYTSDPTQVQGGMHQQLMNNAPLQNLPNSFGQFGTADLENMPGNYAQTPEYYSGHYANNFNVSSNDSIIQQGNSGLVPQSSNWSLSMTVPNSDTNERVVRSSGNPGSFKNPLLESSTDGPTGTAELLRNLEIESKKFERLIANKPAVPTHIPQSSLIMLQKQLTQAAEAFSSPEAYRLARERELGFDTISDVGTTVIVSNLSAQAADFVPRSRSPAAHTRIIKAASQDEETAVLTSLTKLIETVLLQPGNFDNLSAVFINQVRTHTHSDETVKEMVGMIFNKAIIEENFKYLGARLCDKLTTPDVLSNFRTNFLNQLQKEFKTIEEFFDTAMDENITKIHGFITFMAEIFIHIKINGQPIRALGKSLGRFLGKLLSQPDQNVTFVCKVMKLAGAKLRDALSTNEDDNKIYERAFILLKEHSDKQTNKDEEKTKRMLLLITSVLRLKDSNWGRTESSTRKKSSIADPEDYGDQLSEVDQNYYMNEPVFFTPDGIQYTAAEAQIPEFYDQHLAKFNVAEDTSNEDAIAFPWNPKDHYFDDYIPSDEEAEFYKEDDSEYDDEFEKFLAESGQLH